MQALFFIFDELMKELFLHTLKVFLRSWRVGSAAKSTYCSIASTSNRSYTIFIALRPGELMPLASLGTCIHVPVCAKIHTSLKIIQSKN